MGWVGVDGGAHEGFGRVNAVDGRDVVARKTRGGRKQPMQLGVVAVGWPGVVDCWVWLVGVPWVAWWSLRGPAGVVVAARPCLGGWTVYVPLLVLLGCVLGWHVPSRGFSVWKLRVCRRGVDGVAGCRRCVGLGAWWR